MLKILFSGAKRSEGCISTAISFGGAFDTFRGYTRRVECKTLAECEVAFADAAAFARSIPASLVEEVTKGCTDGEPVVAVFGYWEGRNRKPNGFNKRKWELYTPAMD